MLEEYGFFVLIAGVVVAIAGWIWLVRAAFKESKQWGYGVLLLPVVPHVIVFVLTHLRRSRGPLLVLLLAGMLLGAPYAANYYHEKFMHLGPREKIVKTKDDKKERHFTLTGWDESNYSFLQTKPDTVVLQMANPNVTDETLNYLRGMDQLRELDLSDTQVTDEGLAVVAGLPRLEDLRMARTKITDAGFQKYLGAKESLLKLDLTGTDVKGKTKREWKKAKPGRECLE
jgi:hypothetical protein